MTFLADSDDPVVFTVGTALENVYLLGFVYSVLSFPSGRLRGRLERILSGIGGAGGSRGSGLRGLADRVEAIDGRLAVSSPPGRGTKVRAEIPCV